MILTVLARSLPFLAIALIASSRSVLLTAQGEDVPELRLARDIYEKDVEFATRPIRDRYLSRLDSLKRTLGSKGNVRAALAVQEEIDRVSRSSQNGLAGKFEGIWKIDYANGATRRYWIKPDGQVQGEDEKGKPIPAISGKITTKGEDTVIELTSENKLERLTLDGNLLTVEHFDPMITYPNGTPVLRGKGTRSQARR
jgi:hypothetical protein